MKNFMKAISLMICMIFIVSMVGCSTEPTDTKYKVGICQLVQFAAHDEATDGFKDAIEAALPGQVTYLEENAANDISLCNSIVTQFISENVDLILANATPALQAAANATNAIPILGTAITEYRVVMGLENIPNAEVNTVSGTSDFTSPSEQAKMLQTWFPNENTVGLLYCSAEPNSKYQIDTITAELQNLGYTCVDMAFTEANDLPLVLEKARTECDFLYIPTDNTVAANSAIIDNFCRAEYIPVIGGDEGLCKACSVATLAIDYYSLGYKTGEMAVKILTNQAEISDLEIQYADYSPVYNKELCEYLGLTPADGYTPID